MPSRQTRRNGIARIGISVANVTAPAKKRCDRLPSSSCASQWSATIDSGSSPFSLVGEDLTYNMPSSLTSDSFVFYVGFDPQALTPQAKSPRRK